MKISTIALSAGQAPWIEIASTNPNASKIHLSPANGIPIASYQQFIGAFENQFNFTGMDSRGAWLGQADPENQFRVDQFADDLIAAIEQQYSEPIIGMGHSHGGLITAAAAIKRPDLFSKLVIIEVASMPTAFVGWWITRMPKWMVHKLVPMVRGSHERQRVWPSKAAFYERYKGHSTFRRFTERAMRDYTEHGLRERGDGQFELVYNPSWESHIFRTVGFAWDHLRRVEVPSLLIRAEHSTLYSEQQFNSYNHKLKDNFDTLEVATAGHLLTHEQPQITASAIQNWLNQH